VQQGYLVGKRLLVKHVIYIRFQNRKHLGKIPTVQGCHQALIEEPISDVDSSSELCFVVARRRNRSENFEYNYKDMSKQLLPINLRTNAEGILTFRDVYY
jgi:hypothetical protein